MSQTIEGTIVNGVELFEDYYVKVLHSPGKRDGFVGKFRAARVTEDGDVVAVDVWGGRLKGRVESYRTIPIERVHIPSERVQNRLQKDDEARRAKGLAPKRRVYSDV